MVEIAASPEAYHEIVKTMFEDGVFSEGRMTVLSYYTTEVCKFHPEIASEIQQEYSKFLSSIKSKQKGYTCCII